MHFCFTYLRDDYMRWAGSFVARCAILHHFKSNVTINNKHCWNCFGKLKVNWLVLLCWPVFLKASQLGWWSQLIPCNIVYTTPHPPFLLESWTSYQIFKKVGLDRTSTVREGLVRKRGWLFSGGSTIFT